MAVTDRTGCLKLGCPWGRGVSLLMRMKVAFLQDWAFGSRPESLSIQEADG